MVIDGVNRFRGFEKVKGAPDGTKLPVRGSDGSAGYDFFAPCDIKVPPKDEKNGMSELIFMNVKAYMQPGEYLGVMIRSSMAVKQEKGHLQVAQGTAVIDQDYYGNETNDGNIGVMFQNKTDKEIIIPKGTRCCQGIFQPYLLADNDITLGSRKGGYGSTGV